jgi:hypothetical protein
VLLVRRRNWTCSGCACHYPARPSTRRQRKEGLIQPAPFVTQQGALKRLQITPFPGLTATFNLPHGERSGGAQNIHQKPTSSRMILSSSRFVPTSGQGGPAPRCVSANRARGVRGKSRSIAPPTPTPPIPPPLDAATTERAYAESHGASHPPHRLLPIPPPRAATGQAPAKTRNIVAMVMMAPISAMDGPTTRMYESPPCAHTCHYAVYARHMNDCIRCKCTLFTAHGTFRHPTLYQYRHALSTDTCTTSTHSSSHS